MKDMFYNYDNCIDRKEYPKPLPPQEHYKVLSCPPNMELILDAKGNEIGISVRRNTSFELFFYMCGNVEGSSIEELVLNSIINFQILGYRNEVMLTKTLKPEDAYIGEDTIKVSVDASEVVDFKCENYKMKLTLTWPGGGYELFNEDSGILAIN